MAQKPNPKKVAAVIAATKAQAGGRPVQIRTTAQGPQSGMPGSSKPAMLGEVVIKSTPIVKKVEAVTASPEKEMKIQTVKLTGWGEVPKHKVDEILNKDPNLRKYIKGSQAKYGQFNGIHTYGREESDMLAKLLKLKK